MPGRFGHRFGPRRRKLGAPVGGGIAWTPAQLFTNGERGMFWDLSDQSLANMSQSIAGTGTVASTSVVGFLKDGSPNANSWFAASDGNSRPTLQVDSDSKNYLSFDGSNDVLLATVPFITPSSNVAFTAVIGMFGAAQSATKTMLSVNSTASSQPLVIPFQPLTTTTSIQQAVRNDAGGLGVGALTATALLDSTKRVLTSAWMGPTGAGTQRIRDAASRPSGGGTGSYTSQSNTGPGSTITVTRSGLGANCAATPANFFAGRIYSGCVINRYLTDAEIKALEDWAASKCLASPLP